MTAAVVLNGALLRIPTDQVVPGPNPRGDLGDLRELAQSLQRLGQQKPLIVSALPDGRYQLLDGHRRHAAAQLVHLPTVDAVLRRDGGPAIRLMQQIALHTHSMAFDPITDAHALHTLMFEHGMTREQIAAMVGRSPVWVRNRIALVHLTSEEQDNVRSGECGIDQALRILNARRTGYATPREKSRAVKSVHAEAQRKGKHCASCTCHNTAGNLPEVDAQLLRPLAGAS